jgi:hypothetical protein
VEVGYDHISAPGDLEAVPVTTSLSTISQQTSHLVQLVQGQLHLQLLTLSNISKTSSICGQVQYSKTHQLQVQGNSASR